MYAPLNAQVVINEVSTANDAYFIDENGDFKDWIELYNPGFTPFNLNGYSLVRVENGKNKKWFFPSFATIPAQGHLTFFASGKDYNFFIDHWEIPVATGNTWRYFEGVSEPDASWRDPSYDDSAWPSGIGSFGYGDGDDATIINQTYSLYLRQTFNVPNPTIFNSALLIIDYDDAFIAYLNGQEIARSNIYIPNPLYTDSAYEDHEAQYYQSGSPDYYFINDVSLNALLVTGANVLTIHVLNVSSASSDMSCFADLIMGTPYSTITFPVFATSTVFIAHTSFALSSNGTHLKLLDPLGNVVDQKTIPALQRNHTLARVPDGGSWCLTDNPTPTSSNDLANCYIGYAPIPSFSPPAGFYPTPQLVNISTQSGYTTHYTLNGDEPTPSSFIYLGPILIDSTTVVKARSFSAGSELPSATITNTYLINESFSLPVLSISADYSDMFDPVTGLLNNPFNDALKITAHCEFFKKNNGKQGFEADHYLRLHGNYSQSYAQKSLKVILSDDLGQQDIDYTIIPDKPYVTKYKSFNVRNGGVDNFPLGIGAAFPYPTHFADDFQQRAAKTTQVDYIGSEPCIVFLNGMYWGLYAIRERGDEDYLEQNYEINPDKVDIIRFENDVMEGTIDNWDTCSNFAINNNMADPGNFATANQLFDLENFCDFFITQTYYGNGDWIYEDGWTNNCRFWCTNAPIGKWRYIFWDMEAGCGVYGQPLDNNYLPVALNPANSLHSAIMNSLLNNPGFKNYFINRYADLMNTIFLPDSMVENINYFKDLFLPDMPRHIQRWDITGTILVSQWLGNIDTLIGYVNNRPPYAREIVRSYFALNKVVDVTLQTDPPEAGKIKISTITPGPLPWTGKYFDGNQVTISTTANPGYVFSYWETQQFPYAPINSLTLNIDTNQTIIAHYVRVDADIYSYPNPFSDYFTLVYQIPVDGQVTISIYDITGKCIGIPVSASQFSTQGIHQLIIQPELYGMNSGVYFIEMRTKTFVETIKVIHVNNNN